MVNASPLILLARAGLLGFLQLVSERAVVPQAVADEIRHGKAADAAIHALDEVEWLTIVPTSPVPPVVAACRLDPGEEAVLAWAYAHPGGEAILDDLAARRCAAKLGIPVRGTLGLVLIAKQRGVIPAARPIVEQLRQSGMYLATEVIERALARIGE